MRAVSVLPAGGWDAASAVATVTLDYDARHRRRFRYQAGGIDLLLDLKRAVLLNEGDGLVLEEGGVVRVAAAPEALLEVTAGPGGDLARLAYHLGNRHLPVQLGPGRILIRADHVIAEMVAGLGGVATPLQAPFTPEPGAYEGADAAPARGHDHGHHHDDGHHHHGGHHHHHD